MPCHIRSYHVAACHVISCHDMLCHVMSQHIMPCHTWSHYVIIIMSCHVRYTATPLLVCDHDSSIHCTLAGNHSFGHIANTCFVVILTLTKVGYGACIKHNIQINTSKSTSKLTLINKTLLTEDEYTSDSELIC